MKTFFAIQFKRIYRHLDDFGINPILGLILISLVFISFSSFLFTQLSFAKWIYLLLALFAKSALNSDRAKEMLKLNIDAPLIRWSINTLQNALILLPFLIVLLIQRETMVALILLGFVFIDLPSGQGTQRFFSFPTPFSKTPFEFTIGFRRSLLVYLLSYTLTTIAVIVGNFNLGVVAMILLMLSCANFYTKTEPETFVIAYNEGPLQMLKAKAIIGVKQLLISVLPIVILLIVFEAEQVGLVLLFLLAGILFLLTNIFIKYAHFPNDADFVRMVLVPFMILFPPLLLFLMPYYYHLAKKRLTHLTK